MSNKEEPKKMFAETMIINQPAKQISDYVFRLEQKYIVDERNTWENFMLDHLYDFYKKHGFTKVLMISKEDYKKFLEWAVPKYKKEVLEQCVKEK